jgi:nicotinate-nucleotide adenylyltransferase
MKSKHSKSTGLKRIALLGGTFDPIHLGHIHLAREIVKQFHFKEIRIVPSKIPPHREKPQAKNQDRIAMIRLALAAPPNRQLKLDLTELNLRGKSFTVKTLLRLRKKFGARAALFFVMSSDAFADFLNWYQPQKILKLTNLIITHRPKTKFKPTNDLLKLINAHKITAKNVFLSSPSGKIFFLKAKMLNISSSKIRALSGKKRNAKKYLAPSISKYIDLNKLYRNK